MAPRERNPVSGSGRLTGDWTEETTTRLPPSRALTTRSFQEEEAE
jgi:hypothetical protein